ncbi:hypothetical protein CKO25_20235 [Thiocapsa imhoffii]|uniref:Uncharacterized protein n=1 Tax=Thiocapsa imhoffii TaxID=382777 RepID=A0A9X1BAD4_9GAMM|nr:hypothetical protein [Thiocapsa imhoffii]MBK1646909.1 hypothetical protein [Thiocapsa imhoffii]
MILKAIIDDQIYELNVPNAMIAQAQPFFDQLDADMAAGWQMSREWVEQPDQLQRCQIIADKLLTAIETENQKLGLLMAGYLIARLPGVESVELDIQGEIQNNRFRIAEQRPAPPAPTDAPAAPGRPGGQPDQLAAEAGEPAARVPGRLRGLSKLAAMEQAGKDITTVFKVGRGWRFSIFDHATGTWQDGPLASSETDAARLRQQAFKARYEALQRPAEE